MQCKQEGCEAEAKFRVYARVAELEARLRTWEGIRTCLCADCLGQLDAATARAAEEGEG